MSKKTAGQKYVSERYNTANMAAAFDKAARIERLANKEKFQWLPDHTCDEWIDNNDGISPKECKTTLLDCFLAGMDSEDEDA